MKKLLLITGTVGILLAVSCDKKQVEPAMENENTPPPRKSPERGDSTPALKPQVDTVENLAKEFSRQLKRMTSAMAKVQDTASAKQAAQTVTLVGTEFKSIVGRLQNLEVPSEALKRSISEEMESRASEMAESLGGRKAFLNSLDPKARAILDEAMENFDETMTELDPIMNEYFEVSESGATPPTPRVPNRPTVLPEDLPRQPVP